MSGNGNDQQVANQGQYSGLPTSGVDRTFFQDNKSANYHEVADVTQHDNKNNVHTYTRREINIQMKKK
ncbi:hypothetical protein CRE_24828 [Caenorhabditis remanei]|uniref:Uncharacterized protein n=1 Tax=Caenorhabditis remanei TaxID=31234 RepID=E3NHN7_CAERE|nr:hypothetical protein CRE_24828 [Caenorhabditis remanei]